MVSQSEIYELLKKIGSGTNAEILEELSKEGKQMSVSNLNERLRKMLRFGLVERTWAPREGRGGRYSRAKYNLPLQKEAKE